MSIHPKIKKAVEWYSKNRPLFDSLAIKIESIIKENLRLNKVDYYRISSRAKTVSSYKKKASMSRYKQPRKEIMDMAGIRVITYTDSDAKKANELIKNTFLIYPEYSVDKTDELGTDKVGYRSIHCVGTLSTDRLRLPENQIFKNICFEIQLRTILQHAWAEFEHDRNYKFSGVLPREIKRRLSILAGNLELIDREFDNISKDIDAYILDIGKRTKIGKLEVSINSTSLKEYMNRKFALLLEKGMKPKLSNDQEIIDHLNKMGITTLQELDNSIPEDYIKTRLNFAGDNIGNYYGVIVDILMIKDTDKYFKKVWQNSWDAIDPIEIQFFKHFNIDLLEYSRKYGFDLEDY